MLANTSIPHLHLKLVLGNTIGFILPRNQAVSINLHLTPSKVREAPPMRYAYKSTKHDINENGPYKKIAC